MPQAAWQKASVYSVAAIMPFAAFLNLGQLERTQIDKWYQQASEPTRIVQRLVEAPSAQIPRVSQVEIITLDKWFRPTEQPLFDTKRAQFTDPFLAIDTSQLTQKERTTPDRWQPATNQPLFTTAQNQHLFPTFVVDGKQLTLVERSTPDKWLSAAPLLFRSLQAQYLFGGSVAPLQTSAPTEIITVDKWYRQPDAPALAAKRWQYAFPAAVIDVRQLTQSERITPDKWQPDTNKPLFDLKRQQASYPTQVLNVLPIGLPAFYDSTAVHQTNVPLFSQKHLEYLFQSFAISPTGLTLREATSVDRWFVNPLNPPLKARAHSFVFPAGNRDTRIIAPEIITVDKWFRETGRPTFLPKNHWHIEYNFRRDIVVNKWRLVNRDSDATYTGVLRDSNASYNQVGRSSDAAYNPVTRASDAAYNPMPRASDDSWHNVPRET